MSVGVGPWIDPSVQFERTGRKRERGGRFGDHARGVGIWLGVLFALALLASREGALTLIAGF